MGHCFVFIHIFSGHFLRRIDHRIYMAILILKIYRTWGVRASHVDQGSRSRFPARVLQRPAASNGFRHINVPTLKCHGRSLSGNIFLPAVLKVIFLAHS